MHVIDTPTKPILLFPNERIQKLDAFDTDYRTLREILFSNRDKIWKLDTISTKTGLDKEVILSLIERNNIWPIVNALHSINNGNLEYKEVHILTKNPQKHVSEQFSLECKRSIEKFDIIVATIARDANNSQLSMIGKELEIPRRHWTTYRRLFANNISDYRSKMAQRGLIESDTINTFKRGARRKYPKENDITTDFKLYNEKHFLPKLGNMVEEAKRYSFYPMSKTITSIAEELDCLLYSISALLIAKIEQNFN